MITLEEISLIRSIDKSKTDEEVYKLLNNIPIDNTQVKADKGRIRRFSRRTTWTKGETITLIEMTLNLLSFEDISEALGNKTPEQCRKKIQNMSTRDLHLFDSCIYELTGYKQGSEKCVEIRNKVIKACYE